MMWRHDQLSCTLIPTSSSTGYEARLQCAFCYGEIKDWKTGDTPKSKHQILFPYCKVTRGKPTNNVPIFIRRSAKALDVCLARFAAANKLSVTKTQRALNLRMTTWNPKERYYVQDRAITFPDDFPIKPEKMAAGGFYYRKPVANNPCIVECFWCSGRFYGVNNWEDNEDYVWTKHAQ